MRSIALLASSVLPFLHAVAVVLWYGGDFDGRNGIRSSHAAGARARYDFDLTATNAMIAGLFGNFLSLGGPQSFTEASYEIRSGVTEGNGGKLLASGISSANVVIIGESGCIGNLQCVDRQLERAVGRRSVLDVTRASFRVWRVLCRYNEWRKWSWQSDWKRKFVFRLAVARIQFCTWNGRLWTWYLGSLLWCSGEFGT